MDDLFHWQGRFDGDGPEHQRIYQVVNQSDRAIFAVLGFSSDEGVRRNHGRIGAAEAPDLIRKQLANLAVHHTISIQDLGTVVCRDGELEKAQTELAHQIDTALQHGYIPLVFGGGHEIAFGSFSGLVQYVQKQNTYQKIGIINFDAHFDLREETQATSGTPFFQAAQLSKQLNQSFHYLCIGIAAHSNTRRLFETAHELNCQYILDREIELGNLDTVLAKVQQFIEQVDVLYITVDLDVFSASIAPGVSAPAVKGIDLNCFEYILRLIQRSGKIKLFDIAECNPRFDQDQLTARLAAYIAYTFMVNHSI